jgi:hypothetical protein
LVQAGLSAFERFAAIFLLEACFRFSKEVSLGLSDPEPGGAKLPRLPETNGSQ